MSPRDCANLSCCPTRKFEVTNAVLRSNLTSLLNCKASIHGDLRLLGAFVELPGTGLRTEEQDNAVFDFAART